MRGRLLGLVLCGLVLHTSPAFAGRSCEERPADPNRVMQGFELAQRVKLKLDESGAEVAIIARAGQDLSKYHLQYSHLGIIRKLDDGRWMVLHELNHCGTAKSDLFNEGLANFFMDDPHRYEALLMIPSAEIQNQIKRAINSPAAKSLHEKRYNMLAHPFSTKYQNSNQWALETIAAALAKDVQIQNREQAQSWLKFANYRATTLEIPMFTRLGGRMFRANIAFDDQPFDRRMAGHIDTVTVDSIDQFLSSRDQGLQHIAVKYP